MIADVVSPGGLVVLLPILAACGLALVRDAALGAWLVVAAAAGTLALAARLPWAMGAGELALVDPLGAHMAVLIAFVGLTSAWFSRGYVRAAGLDGARLRQYHVLFLAFLAALLGAVLSNNLGVAWVAMETATIAGVLVVGLSRTAEALEASWRFFVLCGVGIALALFGTIVLYLAAMPVLGAGLSAMSWNTLAAAAPHARGSLLNLAFVFLVLGYGTKAGLAPLHAWLSDAHAEGPTPVSAVLSTATPVVALTLILRLRGVLAASGEAIAPGPPLMALGLASMLLAAFGLWRRRDAKRFFAFSSIEQTGVAAFAFGLGGPLATAAGVLHVTVHLLAKTAVFHCVGRASQMRGGQRLADLAGLARTRPALGLTLAAGVAAVAGLPPFGLFASEFLVAGETARRLPLLIVPFGLALVVGAWGLAARAIPLCLGPPSEAAERTAAPRWWEMAPSWLHLALAAAFGVAVPAAGGAWLSAVAGAAMAGVP